MNQRKNLPRKSEVSAHCHAPEIKSRISTFKVIGDNLFRLFLNVIHVRVVWKSTFLEFQNSYIDRLSTLNFFRFFERHLEVPNWPLNFQEVHKGQKWKMFFGIKHHRFPSEILCRLRIWSRKLILKHGCWAPGKKP